MTLQEIFNTSAKHLLTQKVRSRQPDYEGSYRSKYRAGSLRCAIGILIKDEFYSEGLEGKMVSNSRIFIALVSSRVVPQMNYDHFKDTDVYDLLISLQEVHDRSDPEEWKEKLVNIARKFDLSEDVLQ